MKITPLHLLPFLFVLLLTAVGCGGSDDDDPEEGNPCQVELVSVTELNDSDFTITLTNTSAQAATYAIDVRYLDGGVQKDFRGIGTTQEVAPGVTVEIETISGDIFTRDDFDCAQLLLTIFPASNAVFCQEGQIGEDCY